MVIVTGEFILEPDQRDAFLAGRHDAMRTSRAEPGCLEYTLAADPIDPSRVVLVERWANQESLDAHLAAMRAPSPGPAPEATIAPSSVSIILYDVTGERSL